jgi:hypothetical protein
VTPAILYRHSAGEIYVDGCPIPADSAFRIKLRHQDAAAQFLREQQWERAHLRMDLAAEIGAALADLAAWERSPHQQIAALAVKGV